MVKLSVADVQVKYRTVEVEETCPSCGARLERRQGSQRNGVRELNLASANYYGAFLSADEDRFEVDPESGEERPHDGVWIVFGYECTGCGELLASGVVDVT